MTSRMSVWIALLLSLAGPGVARAGLADWNGHFAIGYAKLFLSGAPPGSISVSAGVDHPVVPGLSAGLDIGYHLLGSRTSVRGSLFANIDYSLFEVTALAHWTPKHWPLRLSLGPGVFSAHADLSTSGGGAAFSDLAVSEIAGGVSANALLINRSPGLLKVGLEVGTRVAMVPDESWTLAVARVSIHY